MCAVAHPKALRCGSSNRALTIARRTHWRHSPWGPTSRQHVLSPGCTAPQTNAWSGGPATGYCAIFSPAEGCWLLALGRWVRRVPISTPQRSASRLHVFFPLSAFGVSAFCSVPSSLRALRSSFSFQLSPFQLFPTGIPPTRPVAPEDRRCPYRRRSPHRRNRCPSSRAVAAGRRCPHPSRHRDHPGRSPGR